MCSCSQLYRQEQFGLQMNEVSQQHGASLGRQEGDGPLSEPSCSHLLAETRDLGSFFPGDLAIPLWQEGPEVSPRFGHFFPATQQ